ncbi:MAG: glycosyltransferase family 4 protein [Thermoanaerobaculia bacterium]
MRIGIDGRKIADYGIGTWIRGLLGGLAAARAAHDFVLFGPPSIDAFLPPDLRIERRDAGAPHYSLRELLVVGAAARRAKLDLFHAPHYVVPFVSGPVVVTIHDLIHLHRRPVKPFERIYARRMIARAIRRSRIVTTVSETVAGDIERTFPGARGKIEVVPNGVLTRFVSERQPRDEALVGSLGLEAGAFFLFVGNDKPHKNLEGLVAAWRLARGAMPTARLAIAGSEPARFRDEERVSLLGFVDEGLLGVLYRCALAVVLPSWDEGFGLPVAEAMASGTPVICSDIPALREVGGDAPRYVPAGNAEALRDALLGVMRNAHDRDGMIRAGRARAALFSWQRAAERMLAIWDRARS